MARFYSHYHSLAAFLGKCIPKKGKGRYKDLFVHEVIKGLKRLDAVQRDNPFITIPFDVDGLNIVYNGIRIFRIMPAQQHLLVMFADKEREILFDELIQSSLFSDSSRSDYRSWIVSREGLVSLWQTIENLPRPSVTTIEIQYKHPRYFSASARLEAFEDFERAGRMCPGFGARQKHKVAPEDAIEFDHLIPYAKQGSSSRQNIQIMCEECNRLKGNRIS